MTAEAIKQNFEAPLPGKERFLKIFNKLRHEYLEEFPPEILLPDHPNYHLYKCRTNFFATISLAILRLRKLKLISSPRSQAGM